MTAVLDIERICRVCMRGEPEMFLIFDEKYAEERTSVAAMLTECTIYKVDRFDGLPHQICSGCLQAVRQAFHFKRDCERSYRTLLGIVGSSNLSCGGVMLLTSGGGATIKVEEPLEKSTQTEDSTLYPCERCEQKFFAFDALKLHREQEHRGSAIVCRFCSKSFNRIGYLKTHIAVFHPETGYTSHNQCQICQRQFTRREHMRRHMAVIHKIVEIVDENAEVEQLPQDAGDAMPATTELLTTAESEAAAEGDPFAVILTDTETALHEQTLSNLYNKSRDGDDESLSEEGEATEPLPAAATPTDSDDEDEKPLAKLLNNSTKSFMEVLLHTTAADDVLPESIEDPVQPAISSSPESTLTVTESKVQVADVLAVKRRRGRPRRAIRKPSPCALAETHDDYKCAACDEVFQEHATLQRHLLTHAEQQQQLCCKICGKRHANKQLLKCHMNSSHAAAKLMQCEECDKIFTHITQYKRHMETKHSDKTHKCEICEKGFTTKVYLHRHMAIHGKRRYICKECCQSYTTKEELNEHIKAEGHDKPMLCPECGLRCKTNNILMVHMRRHNGEKPFKCRFCSKGFPRTDDLRVHEKYHTGEKSHFCETCGKGFQRKYNLTIHLRVHTGEKPYKCPHCPQAFAQGNDLKAHIRRHTGERFRCEVCGAAFLQGYQIRQHKLTEHGIKEEPPTQRVAKFTSPEEQEQQIKQNLQKELGQPTDDMAENAATSQTIETTVLTTMANTAEDHVISETIQDFLSI